MKVVQVVQDWVVAHLDPALTRRGMTGGDSKEPRSSSQGGSGGSFPYRVIHHLRAFDTRPTRCLRAVS